MEGKGRMEMPEEWEYEGDFSNEERDGQGTMKWKQYIEPGKHVIAPQIHHGDAYDRHRYVGQW